MPPPLERFDGVEAAATTGDGPADPSVTTDLGKQIYHADRPFIYRRTPGEHQGPRSKQVSKDVRKSPLSLHIILDKATDQLVSLRSFPML